MEVPCSQWLSGTRVEGGSLWVWPTSRIQQREYVRVEGQGFDAGDRGSISMMVPDKGHLEKRRKAK